MTAPIQEPSQDRINQGIQFRQRQLFRRPSTGSAGLEWEADGSCLPTGGLKWAVAGYSARSQEIVSGRIRWHANYLETNDASLYSLNTISADPVRGGASEWADWIEIAENGYYVVHYTAWVQAAEFTTQTLIEPLAGDSGGGDNTLINALGYGQYERNFSIENQRISADELNHDEQTTIVGFWFDSAQSGMSTYTPLRLAWRMVTGDADGDFRTLGGLMLITQMATGGNYSRTEI